MTNSSINSLHPETLSHIFSLVVSGDRTIPRVNIFEDPLFNAFADTLTKKAELRRTMSLLSVCRYWRSVTINTSPFWSYIFIDMAGKRVQRGLDRALVWLSRARAMPLDVYIWSSRRESTSLPSVTLNAFPRVLPLVGKQARTLDLSLTATTYFNMILKNLTDDSASNTLLHIFISTSDAIEGSSTLMGWLSQCQRLQTLRLDVNTLHFDYFPSMPSLVDLELRSDSVTVTTEQLSNIFHACPSLRRLKLEEVDVQDTASNDLVPAPLHNLEVLSLWLLDISLVLPMILSESESLRLSIVFDMYAEDLELLDPIIRFSPRATITKLRLNMHYIAPHGLRRLLRSLPKLQTFSLLDSTLDSNMAAALRGCGEPGPGEEAVSSIFPVPRAVWLEQCEIEDEAALRSLVRVRPPQQLRINNCYLPSGPVVESKTLCEDLLDAVSDLVIVGPEESAHFP